MDYFLRSIFVLGSILLSLLMTLYSSASYSGMYGLVNYFLMSFSQLKFLNQGCAFTSSGPLNPSLP